MFNFHSVNTAEVNAGSRYPDNDISTREVYDPAVLSINASEDTNSLSWTSPYFTDFFKVYWSNNPFASIDEPGVNEISQSEVGSFIPGSDPSQLVSYDHAIPAAYSLSVLYYRVYAYNRNGWTLSNQVDSYNFRLAIYQEIYNKTLEELTLRFTPELRRQYEDSTLWRSFVQSLCSELATSRFEIKEAIKQLNLQKAVDVFLNLWNNITGISKINVLDSETGLTQPESDTQYRQRLIDNIFWDKISNLALKKTLMLKLGYDAAVVDVGLDPTDFRTPPGTNPQQQYSANHGPAFMPGEQIAFLFYGNDGLATCVSDDGTTLTFSGYSGPAGTPYDLFGGTSEMYATPTGAPSDAGVADSNTVLLLPFENDFINYAPTTHTFSFPGPGVQLTSADKKVGNYSAIFSGDWIQVDDLMSENLWDFDFSDGTFTIDLWYKPNPTGMTIANTRTLYHHDNHYTYGSIEIYLTHNYFSGQDPNPYEMANVLIKDINGNNQLYVGGAFTGNRGGAAPVPTINWTHLAVVQNGDYWAIYINGSQKAWSLSSVRCLPYHNYVTIGGKRNTSRYFYGYMDEFRISNVARWTSNFTVPGDYLAAGLRTIAHAPVRNPFIALGPFKENDAVTFDGVIGNHSEGLIASDINGSIKYVLTSGNPQQYDKVRCPLTSFQSVLTSAPEIVTSEGAFVHSKILSNVYSIDLGNQSLSDIALNEIYEQISPLAALGNVLTKILQDIALSFEDWDIQLGNIPYGAIWMGHEPYTGSKDTNSNWSIGEELIIDNQIKMDSSRKFYGNDGPDDIIILKRIT